MQTYLARQPIFDADLDVWAYELLFRTGVENAFPDVEGDEASSSVISDSFTTHGIESLTAGRPAFINFTRNALLNGYAELMPKELAVIEILEDVEPDSLVLRMCRRLKDLGYRIALDDFQYTPKHDPLVELADIIKVDFFLSGSFERDYMVRRFRGKKIQLLAEKVETQEEVDQARKAGYAYFQGYFFAKPQIMGAHRIPETQVSRLALMREAGQQGLDYSKLEEVLKRDISLSYRLLKYINSSFFGLRNEIHSIRQALALLGERNVRKWVHLVCLSALGEDKSPELLQNSVCRARFCEQLAERGQLAGRGEDLFLLGMFSLLDAIIDQPMADVVEQVPLSADVKAALLGEANPLRAFLDLVIAYEQGEWGRVDACKQHVPVRTEDVPAMYFEALAWADELVGMSSEAENTARAR